MVGLSALAAGLAACLAFGGSHGRRRARLRLLHVLQAEADTGGSRPVPPTRRQPDSIAALVAVAALLLFGWPGGTIPALLAGLGTRRLLTRLEPSTARRDREAITADLPMAATLLAACLNAGLLPLAAVRVAADSLGGPLGHRLRQVAATVRLGGDPIDAWAEFGAEPSLASLGRAFGRAMDSGAPLAEAIMRVATDARVTQQSAREAEARRVGVRCAAPLGLCFLPAFLALGVIPTVLSVALAIR